MDAKIDRPLIVDALSVGPLQTMCYIVADKATDEAMIVDPGADADMILESVATLNADPQYLVLTHGHADHIAAVEAMKEKFPDIVICIHRLDGPMLFEPNLNLSTFMGEHIVAPKAERLLEEGDEINLGENSFRVIHLPGHTPGGIGLYWPGTEKIAGILISGDALFAGGIGRTDFPGGDEETLLRVIREKILTLPDDTMVFPGHGPSTNIKIEKETNPFLTNEGVR